jgi:hypothetical protein
MVLNRRYAAAAMAGVFFGAGFLCGFLSGYRYAAANVACELPPAAVNYGVISEDAPAAPESSPEAETVSGGADAGAETSDIGLELDDYWMDSDDNGLFIAGAVKNSGASAFDSVMVAFDLLDVGGAAYTAVTARNGERVEPGDAWDFAIYIPYSELDKFKSFRLQSVMGVKR